MKTNQAARKTYQPMCLTTDFAFRNHHENESFDTTFNTRNVPLKSLPNTPEIY